MRESFKGAEIFRSLVEEISDGIIALDHQWRIVYVNHTAEKMLNREKGSLLEKIIWEEFPGSVNGKFYQAFHQAILSQSKILVEEYSMVLGRWTRANIYPSSKGLIVYFQDTTSERKAEIRADASEANYRQFLDRITDGFIVLDKDFRYVYVNNKIGELVRRNPQSLIGKNVWKEFPEAVNSLTYKAFETAFKEQRFISNIDYYEPLQLWQENHIYPSAEGLSIFIKDISDRKKLEKELREKVREQQFELMITALEAQEKERTLIGQELHDNVNQLLVASKLMLAQMRDDPQRVGQDVLSKCIANLEKVISENRRISHELVTPDLAGQNLVDQLQILINTMFSSAQTKASINASAFSEEALDEVRKLAVYRIAQEQCTNIIKHASAKKVNITLSSDDAFFSMTIADNGIGMDKSKITAGIGLRNIGARAVFFGGHMHITSKPNVGFQLQITLPIAAETTPAFSITPDFVI